MREAVIGADGFIGGHLARLLPEAVHTTRRPMVDVDGRWPFDLLQFGPLPDADVVYVCIGVNGQMRCEGNPQAHHVNVDSTIRLLRHYIAQRAFPVWISSRSLEWCGSTYSRQKALVEAAMVLQPLAIVRAGRVTPQNVPDLCETLVRIGRAKVQGLSIWGTDEISYQK